MLHHPHISDQCQSGYYRKEGQCVNCPPTVSCAAAVEKHVKITTTTTLGFEGGAAALQKDANKAKFAQAITNAMASGEHALVVTVEVISVSRADVIGVTHGVAIAVVVAAAHEKTSITRPPFVAFLSL